jgi:hypothetical protein
MALLSGILYLRYGRERSLLIMTLSNSATLGPSCAMIIFSLGMTSHLLPFPHGTRGYVTQPLQLIAVSNTQH